MRNGLVKLIIFDLDGVLIDAKDIHYDALNEALGESYAISRDEHHNIYDGRKTFEKLNMLTERKGLPVERHQEIYERKQDITMREIRKLWAVSEHIKLFMELDEQGYKIAVCSNSIRRTVLTALSQVGLMEYCSLALSNDDVDNSKPHPEMYWKAMSIMGVLPEETLIVEDSPPGLLAAARSSARYIRVSHPLDVTRRLIFDNLEGEPIMKKWQDKKLNVLIPMAGAGSRFQEAGYTFPKPLIDVNGKPMIQVVVENLGLDANYIFIAQQEHELKYNITAMLGLIAPDCKVILIDGITEGAACTALKAREYIDNDNPLFFANSDQYVEWEPVEFMYNMQEKNCDGGIVTFQATHPKWSFAKVDDNGLVTEVAEKKPISSNATVGYYYWKQGSDFVKYADQMIDKNIRVNNEFYVCPVFNEAIQDGKEIRTYEAERMWGLGVPEDLNTFLREKHERT